MKSLALFLLAISAWAAPSYSLARLVGYTDLANVEPETYVVVGSFRQISKQSVELRLTTVLKGPQGRLPPVLTLARSAIRDDAGEYAEGVFLLRGSRGESALEGSRNPVVFVPSTVPIGGGRYDDEVVGLLSRSIEADDDTLCRSAGRSRCSETLISSIRSEALNALVAFRGRSATAALARMASNHRVEVSIQGHSGLARLGHFSRLSEIGAVITDPLPQHLSALQSLSYAVAGAERSNEARAASLLLLKSSNASLRRDGACGLRASVMPSDVPLLSSLINDNDGRVRYYGASALARLYGKDDFTVQFFVDNESQIISSASAWISNGPPKRIEYRAEAHSAIGND